MLGVVQNDLEVNSIGFKMVKLITSQEAIDKLGLVNLSLSQWKGIAIKDGDSSKDWRKLEVSEKASTSFHFCDDLGSLLSKSDWVIIQIDFSSNFSSIEDRYLSQIVFGRDSGCDITSGATILITAPSEGGGVDHTIIRDLAFFFLIFEQHCYIATSKSDSEGYFGIQDGSIYFIRQGSADGGYMNALSPKE